MRTILVPACAAFVAATVAARAAVFVLHQQTFDTDPGASYSLLTGTSFSGGYGFTGGFGNSGLGSVDVENPVSASGGSSPSGPGSWRGHFAAQSIPAPETGTLRITAPGFLADYDSTYSGYSQYFLGFAFYASVIPSDMIMTIGNGTDTYVYNLLPQITLSGWNTVYVYFNSGWLGSGSSISDPLNTMTYIDISWSRNGITAQQFYFDDFTLFGNDDSLSAIPEPDMVKSLTFALLLVSLSGLRRRVVREA